MGVSALHACRCLARYSTPLAENEAELQRMRAAGGAAQASLPGLHSRYGRALLVKVAEQRILDHALVDCMARSNKTKRPRAL